MRFQHVSNYAQFNSHLIWVNMRLKERHTERHPQPKGRHHLSVQQELLKLFNLALFRVGRFLADVHVFGEVIGFPIENAPQILASQNWNFCNSKGSQQFGKTSRME